MSVYMAHALRRISYATCDPEHSQFSFLAREPKGHFSLQYCHSFLTQSSEQAEELNTIVGNAFRMAYAAQLQKRQQTTFNDLLVNQQQPRGLYEGITDHSPLTTPPSSCDNSPIHRQSSVTHLASVTLVNSNTNSLPRDPYDRKDKYSGYNRLWAKQLIGRTRHKEPVLERVVEMNVLSGMTGSPYRRHLDQANGNLTPVNLSPSHRCSPSMLNGSGSPSRSPAKPHSISGLDSSARHTDDLASPSSTTSSDGANSPTELNSYKRLVDKPPLIKRLTMAIGDGVEEELCPLVKDCPSSPRSGSGGYINEGMESNVGNLIEDISLKERNQHFDYPNNSPTHSLKKLNDLKVRPLPSPPFADSYMDQSSDGSKRSSQSSEGQDSTLLLQETLVIQESPSPYLRNDSRVIQDSPKNDLKVKRISQLSGSSCSSGSSPPPPPERYDSLQSTNNTEEGELRRAPWFQAGIPREIALEILNQEPIGAFMVRESTTKPGCYALSLRVPREFQPTGIAHYLIMKTNKGYKIKGFTKEFSTLTALITHHSVMPELLPCPLSLNRYNPNFAKHDSNQDFADIDEDPDYNTLSDFRKMMADLNV